MKMRTGFLLVAMSAVALLGTACGDDQVDGSERAGTDARSSADPEPSVSPSHEGGHASSQKGEQVRAEVIDTDFRPRKITVSPGTTVVWTQIGDQPHSVTAADGSFDSSPDCGPIESDECLGEGDTFKEKFEKSGTYEYYCRVHGLPDGTGMVGTVVVE